MCNLPYFRSGSGQRSGALATSRSVHAPNQRRSSHTQLPDAELQIIYHFLESKNYVACG